MNKKNKEIKLLSALSKHYLALSTTKYTLFFNKQPVYKQSASDGKLLSDFQGSTLFY